MPHVIHLFESQERLHALLKSASEHPYREELKRMGERPGMVPKLILKTPFDDVTEDLWAKFETREMDTSEPDDACRLIFGFFARGWNAHLELRRRSRTDSPPDVRADDLLTEWQRAKNPNAIRGYAIAPPLRRQLALIHSTVDTLTAPSFVGLAKLAFLDGWSACLTMGVPPG